VRGHPVLPGGVSRPALAAAAALVVLYAIQLPGPLRIDTDSAYYLNLAASFADGDGLRPPGAATFPPGLPVLLGALDAVGLGTPWAFDLMNFAFLALGLASVAVTLRLGLGLSRRATTVLCLLAPLSVYFLKYSLLPLSEIPFFGVASLAVALLVLAHRRADPRLLALGIAAAAGACTIRTAGIALVPAIVLGFRSTRSRLAAAAGSLVLGVAAFLLNPRYLDELRGGWEGSPAGDAAHQARALWELIGAALLNVPISRMDRVEPLLAVAGALAAVAVVAALVRRRHVLDPADGWLIGSLALLYAWPSGHPRFVLPFLPVLAGYVWIGAGQRRWLAVGWGGLIAVSGLAAMAVSIALAYSGTDFPERYASGALAPTYRVAWGIARPGDRRHIADEPLRALERYDPRPPRFP
jgi:hypothetical protein